MPALDDHSVCALVGPCAVALGRLPPWTDWNTPLTSTTFATTVRVINRIHSHASHGRPNTAPALSTSLTDFPEVVFLITDLTNRCTAFDMDSANLTGTQANLGITAFPRQKLNGCSS